MAVSVYFNRAMAPYNAGETAAFPPDRADEICRQGYGTKVAVPASPKSKPEVGDGEAVPVKK